MSENGEGAEGAEGAPAEEITYPDQKVILSKEVLQKGL
jgi:hypothetical protein